MTFPTMNRWANTGDVVAPDNTKISVGWLEGEKPPHEYMNWWMREINDRMNHVLSYGVASWNTQISYPRGAMVSHANKTYRATQPNSNSEPGVGPDWLRVVDNASAITTGVLPVGQVPDLDASKITSGKLNVNRVPNLDANLITSGVLDVGRIPDMSASKITSGTLGVARIPGLPASQITSGKMDDNRIAQSNVTQHQGAITGTGTLDSGSISSGFGAINIGTSKFTGNGSGIDNINASNISTGELPNGRLSGDYTQVTSLQASGNITSGGRMEAVFFKSAGTGGFDNPDLNLTSGHGVYTHNSNAVRIKISNQDVFQLTQSDVTVMGSTGLKLQGGVFQGDGSQITNINANNIASGKVDAARLPTNSSARDWITDHLSSMNVGELGQIAFLGSESRRAWVAGNTYSGSSLRWSGIVRDSGSAADVFIGNVSPNGTWMALGTSDVPDEARSICIFRRVA